MRGTGTLSQTPPFQTPFSASQPSRPGIQGKAYRAKQGNPKRQARTHKEQGLLIWIQEGFTAETPRNDSGANFKGNDSNFGPKVRVTGQKSELQAKSQSYRPKDPQNPNRIARKRRPNRVLVLLQKTPLKAFLNPPKGLPYK